MPQSTNQLDLAAATLYDPRWAAVVARNAQADGTFYYSVSTTGVYCRPSCPSRQARPEHVRFHGTPAAAERAGFRPCKRCKPEQTAAGHRRAEQIAAACRLIEAAESVPALRALAAAAGMSPYHFHRTFKQLTGLTPRQYAAGQRAQRVRERLPGSKSVTEAMLDAGFNSSARFYAQAEHALGMPPAVYRTGGVNTEIRFAVGECSLGSILAAQSPRGLCAIFLGDDPDRLVRELQDRFPGARLIGGEPDFETVVARVVGFVDAPRIGLDLPLDVRGTAFQQRVWRALSAIPAGTTASYAEIAARIGAPRGARAVAQACAANPLAVAIPCHRVVRNDGTLSGYRWGVQRKRALLDRERGA